MNNEDLDLLDESRTKKKPLFAQARTLWRRRWYVFAPVFILGISSFVVAELWPLLYRSESLILGEGQKVPEQYVTPNVVSTLQSRLDSMTQRILSRTRLQRLIEDFGLDTKERAHMVMDDVMDLMRKNTGVEVVQGQGRNGDVTGFRIAFSAHDPKTAQRVANEITSLFIEESLRARSQQSISTTSFLETQLEQARKDLEAQEGRLREYKNQFIGELPEQQPANLQILSSLQAQMYAVTENLARAEQQRIYLESFKSQYPRAETIRGGGSVVNGKIVTTSPARAAADSALTELRAAYARGQAKYTEQHPVMIQITREMAEWDKRIAELDKTEQAAPAASTDGPTTATGTPARSPADTALVEIDSRLKAVEAQIASYRKEEETLKERVKSVQAHLNLTPLREQQLSDVTRTYENSRANYQSLLQKKMQSELASNLEKRQQGEQFRVLDPASLPHRGQGRLPIILAGWALAFFLGFGP